MIGLELAIEQGEAPHLEPRDEPGERHLRRIARPRHHRFAEKGPPQREAIKSAHQLAILPAFDRMGVTLGVEIEEHGFDRLADPGFGAIGLGLGAEPDQLAEIAIGGHLEAIGGDRLPERAREVEAVQRQDRPPLGLHPINGFGLAMIGHREHADRIGAEHQFRVEPFHRLRYPASRRSIAVHSAWNAWAAALRGAKPPIAARFAAICSIRLAIGTTGQSG